MPSLRDRPEDIGPLIEHFIEKFSQKNNKEIEGITSEALAICLNYSWPGNVREIENAIENAVVLSEGRLLRPDDLPSYIKAQPSEQRLPDLSKLEGLSYRNQLEYAEKMIIKKALEQSKGNKTHAAKSLGFSIRTMRNKVNKYNL
jgi:two-component system response regulator AtoC